MAGRLSLLGAGKQKVSASFTDPTSIANLKLWLDFSDADTLYVDAGTTKVSADGQAIYQANDKSGVGNNVVQTAQDIRPIYKTNIQNGLSVALFDSRKTSKLSRVFDPQLPQPNTIFAVVKVDTAEDTYAYIYDGTSDARHALLTRTALTPDGYYFISGTATQMIGGTMPKGSYFLTTVIANGASSMLYENGSLIIDCALIGKNPGTSNMGGVYVGGPNDNNPECMIGNYCELIIYNAALSDVDRQLVESYLTTKWAIS